MTWNPSLYLRFQSERTRPAADLCARIEVESPQRVVDLGCGPGNSTAVLRARWPDARLTGIDSDGEMLAAARLGLGSVEWLRDDAATWQPREPFDVVFSNAAIQWVPDHGRLVPRLFAAVRAGGALAVQVPAHLASPVHRHIVEVAELPRWRDAMRPAVGALESHEPAFYYDLLCPLAGRVDSWVTEYQHVLPGPEAVVEWMRATGLRPFLSCLPSDAERDEFVAELVGRVKESYPRRRDGRVIFPFRRVFFVAYR